MGLWERVHQVTDAETTIATARTTYRDDRDGLIDDRSSCLITPAGLGLTLELNLCVVTEVCVADVLIVEFVITEVFILDAVVGKLTFVV